MKTQYDVIIIGAGPAGLSAAMALGRMLRTALVCDDGRPRNKASSHANNLPSQDGIHPAAWRSQARENLKKYETIEFFEGQVVSLKNLGSGFQAKLSSGGEVFFRKVILAYGLQDHLPLAPGFKELWGHSIFHCPYCHGFEVRNRPLGIVGNIPMLAHMIPMIYSLSQDLIMFTNGPSELGPDLEDLLNQKGIRMIESKIKSLDYKASELKSVLLEDGVSIPREGLFIAPNLPLETKSTLGDGLGCQKDEFGLYKVFEMGKTNVPGVFVSGDIMTRQQSVLAAAASGQLAGAGAASEMIHEDYHRGIR